ncbi:MAG: alpha/beta hydrolase [Actinomycetota bacterium]|nr:alpha/beta hydrolase [Actinomycetota bacterium]
MTSRAESTRFSYLSRDALDDTVYRWQPSGPARAVVQLTHGIGQAALHDDKVANALTAQGSLVVAQDHRGPGTAVASGSELGHVESQPCNELFEHSANNDALVLTGRTVPKT